MTDAAIGRGARPWRARASAPAVAAALSALGCPRGPGAADGAAASARSDRADSAAATPAPGPSCATLRGTPSLRRPGLGRRGAPLRLGAIGDPRGAHPLTRAALTRFAERFRSVGVDAVIALGGLGDGAAEIDAVLSSLTAAGAPIFALPGDREPERAFHEGLDRARARGTVDVIDLQRARIVDGDGVALVALPGYPFRSYLLENPVDGTCRYRADDAAALAPLAAAARIPGRPTLLLSYTPPRDARADAGIDRAFGAGLGDPAVTQLIEAAQLAFGLFAHVDEAGGRAVDRIAAGHPGQAISAGAWSERLYLHVGSADAAPREDPPPQPMAVIVELDGGRARYEVLR